MAAGASMRIVAAATHARVIDSLRAPRHRRRRRAENISQLTCLRRMDCGKLAVF
jgi:hypothetical protein